MKNKNKNSDNNDIMNNNNTQLITDTLKLSNILNTYINQIKHRYAQKISIPNLSNVTPSTTITFQAMLTQLRGLIYPNNTNTNSINTNTILNTNNTVNINKNRYYYILTALLYRQST